MREENEINIIKANDNPEMIRVKQRIERMNSQSVFIAIAIEQTRNLKK